MKIEMEIMRDMEIDPEKGSIKKLTEEMTEVVVVDLDKAQELIQIETKLDAIIAENMITLLKAF